MLITFSGIDGSGKTTMSQLVASELTAGGKAAVAARPDYKCNSIIKRFCKRAYGDEHAYYPRISSVVYISTLALDWIDWLHATDMESAEDGILVCDRYIIDVYAQARQYDADIAHFESVLDRFPKPDLSYFLNVDPETAWQRILHRKEPPPHRLESLPELKRLQRSYREIIEQLHWPIIMLDGERGVREIADSVMLDIVSSGANTTIAKGMDRVAAVKDN